jgi:hypothetical protein
VELLKPGGVRAFGVARSPHDDSPSVGKPSRIRGGEGRVRLMRRHRSVARREPSGVASILGGGSVRPAGFFAKGTHLPSRVSWRLQTVRGRSHDTTKQVPLEVRARHAWRGRRSGSPLSRVSADAPGVGISLSSRSCARDKARDKAVASPRVTFRTCGVKAFPTT